MHRALHLDVSEQVDANYRVDVDYQEQKHSNVNQWRERVQESREDDLELLKVSEQFEHSADSHGSDHLSGWSKGGTTYLFDYDESYTAYDYDEVEHIPIVFKISCAVRD